MAVPLEKFVRQLEDSGILAGDTLNDFIPPRANPKDAEELALELVRKKKLTKFQAEEVSKGKGKTLVLGNYVLMEKIGRGGMGQVFKAEHRRMHCTVAIKMLPPNVMKDAAAIARFEREVTAAAKLRLPISLPLMTLTAPMAFTSSSWNWWREATFLRWLKKMGHSLLRRL